MDRIFYKVGLLVALPFALACAPYTGGVPPVLEFVPQPFYNSDSIDVSVKALISINEKGRVTNAKIIEIEPSNASQDKVLKAIRKAKFKPYKRGGSKIGLKDFEHVFEFSAN